MIKKVKISDLIPYANNARTHDDSQVVKIASSIKEFGFNNPVLIDKDNGIIAGHGRVQAAVKLGMTEVPTICLSHLNENQKKAYILADNRLAEDAGWDIELVSIELKELLDGDFDIDLTGFSIDDILNDDEGLTDDDAVPEPPETPVTVLGDIWILGNHRLMCGDSTSIDDVEKLMDGQKADMVFTDPPYGVNIGEKSGGRYIKGDSSIDEMAIIVESAFKNISASIKDGAPYYICAPQGGDQELMMMMMMREAGIKCRHQLIWEKDAAVFSMGRLDYDYMHEPMLYGWKKAHSFYGKNDKSVWKIPRPKSSKLHPTMKPVELVEKAVYNSSKQGDLVLDLFGGSGTTLIASQKNNRNCFMMELDEIYCDVIINRWQDYTGKTAILESTGKEYEKAA